MKVVIVRRALGADDGGTALMTVPPASAWTVIVPRVAYDRQYASFYEQQFLSELSRWMYVQIPLCGEVWPLPMVCGMGSPCAGLSVIADASVSDTGGVCRTLQ